MNLPEFDLAAAHCYFATQCFNHAWELIDKNDRTPEDDEQMLRLNQASIWHWTQRSDCQPRNLSIGYWQSSRIHALLGRAEEARRYAELCLSASPEDDAFLMGYAFEALARASLIANDNAKSAEHLRHAHVFAAQVSDPDDQRLLLADLQTLEPA